MAIMINCVWEYSTKMNLSWFAWTFGARNIFFCHFFLKQYFLLKASWNDFTCDIKVFSFLQNLCVLLYPLLLGLWINRFHWSESPWHLWTFVIFLTTFLFFQFCYLLSIAVALSSEQRYAREFGDSWLLLVRHPVGWCQILRRPAQQIMTTR